MRAVALLLLLALAAAAPPPAAPSFSSPDPTADGSVPIKTIHNCTQDLVALLLHQAPFQGQDGINMLASWGAGYGDLGDYELCSAVRTARYAWVGSALGIALGICVPSSCTREDLYRDLGLVVRKIPGLNTTNVVVRVVEDNDTVGAGGAVMVAVACVLGLLVVSASCLELAHRWRHEKPPDATEYYAYLSDDSENEQLQAYLDQNGGDSRRRRHRNRGLLEASSRNPSRARSGSAVSDASLRSAGRRYLLAFSAVSTLQSLFSPNSDPGEMAVLNGLRVISMGWLVVANSMRYLMGVLKNSRYVMDFVSHRFSFQIVTSATLAVDTFLFLGGFLMARTLLDAVRRLKHPSSSSSSASPPSTRVAVPHTDYNTFAPQDAGDSDDELERDEEAPGAQLRGGGRGSGSSDSEIDITRPELLLLSSSSDGDDILASPHQQRQKREERERRRRRRRRRRRHKRKAKRANRTAALWRVWPIVVAYRISRVLPTLAFVLFSWYTLVPHIANGPMWYELERYISQTCGASGPRWLSTLTFSQNFWPSDLGDTCMEWGWYVAMDLQLYACVGVLAAWLHSRLGGRVGVAFVSLLLVGATALRLVLAYSHNLTPNLMYGEKQYGHGDYMNLIVDKPWSRAPSYLVGVLVYFLFHHVRGLLQHPDGGGGRSAEAAAAAASSSRNQAASYSHTLSWLGLHRGAFSPRTSGGYKSPLRDPEMMPRPTQFLGFGLAFLFIFTTTFGPYRDYSSGKLEWSRASNVAYITFAPFVFSLGIGILVILCLLGLGGACESFLSLRVWRPLAKLTFGAYLLHPAVIRIVYQSAGALIYYRDVNFCYFVVTNLVLSYCASLALYVLVERPFRNLARFVFTGSWSVSKSSREGK